MKLATIAVVLFDDFETLDAMGPVEVFGCQKGWTILFISPHGGDVMSSHGVIIQTEPVGKASFDAVLIPGGAGTRALSDNREFLDWLYELVCNTQLCMTVCTGSALLARTGLLNGLQATTNKQAFSWVTSLNALVSWQPKARWICDSKFYTSSGISAGIDMSLQVVSDILGPCHAHNTAQKMEYVWNEDACDDPFALDQN